MNTLDIQECAVEELHLVGGGATVDFRGIGDIGITPGGAKIMVDTFDIQEIGNIEITVEGLDNKIGKAILDELNGLILDTFQSH